MEYSDKFKTRAVARMLGPGSQSANVIAKEVGVSQPHVVTVAPRGEAEGDVEGRREEATLEAVDARVEAPRRAQRGRRRRGRTRRSAAEGGTPRGRHLTRFRQEALEGLRAQSEKKPRGGSADDKRVKQLEKELRRKEKALAEAAAILVLRKKVQALWGEEGEDTTEDSDK